MPAERQQGRSRQQDLRQHRIEFEVEKRLKELMKTERSKVLESKGEELRKVAGKAAEVGSSRQRMDRAQAGEEEPMCGAGGWQPGWLVWQEAEEVWRGRQRHPLRVGGRRTGGLRAASAPPKYPCASSLRL